MGKCEKCIHEKVCDKSSRQMWSAMKGETECSDFEDRSKYAEVVHGRWISHFDRSECSVCGGICWADSASTYDYCPNCGVKMDEEIQKND